MWDGRYGEKVRKGKCNFAAYVKFSFCTQTSLAGEKPTLGTVLQQNPSVLEPVAVGGGAASKPASSLKPACPASTSPLNWLADLTSGNVNKENKGEHFLLSCGFLGTWVHLERVLATSVAVRTVVRSHVQGKGVLYSRPETWHKCRCFQKEAPVRRTLHKVEIEIFGCLFFILTQYTVPILSTLECSGFSFIFFICAIVSGCLMIV